MSNTATQQTGPDADADMPVLDTVLEDGIFRLDDWLPYQTSFITNRVSGMLARMYGEEFGLSVTGWRIVAVLGSHAPLSAKELAEWTAMDQVGVTRAVALLVGLGLVVRRGDSKDRRRVILRLSKKGAEAYARVVPLARAIEKELVAALHPEEVTQLRRIMEALVQRAAYSLSEQRDWREVVGGGNAGEPEQAQPGNPAPEKTEAP
ncbi:MarR family winged helix-turn-helix transcriptional regulator [Azospirillum sp. TSA6c]|uniref:MarR family winged helix-turn-helix transcriptional regulator n=1 Tax=unclassified Azospirillum TaxID=2630922 RepID=UPI001305042A|nr:MarR family winged helix-turn-helix transcriptional regulator [Azospirillum sp. TSA6c]